MALFQCTFLNSGLRLIDEEDSEEEERMFRRSPIIPIVIPVAIKPKDKMAIEMVNIICLNISLSLLTTLLIKKPCIN